MGTLVQVTEINKLYEDGKMDIKTEGWRFLKYWRSSMSCPKNYTAGLL